MTYRLYTEDLNRDALVDVLKKRFDSFTLIPALGYWKGKGESSLIVELNNVTEGDAREAALSIKQLNKQDAVLMESFQMKGELI